jgi:hypothetical protein
LFTLALERFDDASQLWFQIGAARVVTRHLDYFSPERVRDCALVKAALTQNDGHRVLQAVKREGRAAARRRP